jgi:hypothetical protein
MATAPPRSTGNPVNLFGGPAADGTPQYGLSGSETALISGLGWGEQKVTQGAATADDLLRESQRTGVNAIQNWGTQADAAYDTAGNLMRDALSGSYGNAGVSASAGNFSDAGVNEAIGLGVDALTGFRKPGLQASRYQAALSGALGPEAQREAYARYLESPGQAYLREQGEQAVLRNASATGGLGGGLVLQELQKQGIGMAAQDFQNSYDRLTTLSAQGLTASQAIAQIRAEQAQLASARNIAEGNAQTQANIASAANMTQGGISAMEAGAAADRARAANELALGGERAGAFQTTGQNIADIRTGTGRERANLATDTSRIIGEGYFRTGESLAAGRTGAGEAIAGNIAATSAALAESWAKQGVSTADVLGSLGADTAALLKELGVSEATSLEDLAKILANLAVQEGTAVAGQTVRP